MKGLGTWGVLAFENDETRDWLDALTPDVVIGEVTGAIDALRVQPEIGLAACELLATSRGHPKSSLDLEHQAIIQMLSAAGDELCEKGIAGIEAVLKDKNYIKQWEGEGSSAEWMRYAKDLKERLKKKRRTSNKPNKPKDSDRAESTDLPNPQLIISYFPDEVCESRIIYDALSGEPVGDAPPLYELPQHSLISTVKMIQLEGEPSPEVMEGITKLYSIRPTVELYLIVKLNTHPLRNLSVVRYFPGLKSLHVVASEYRKPLVKEFVLDELPSSTTVSKLHINSYKGDFTEHFFRSLSDVEELSLWSNEIQTTEHLKYVTKLRHLAICDLTTEELQGIEDLKHLEYLRIAGSKKLKRLPPGLSSLDKLYVEDCTVLEESKLPLGYGNLTTLGVDGCRALQSLRGFEASTRMEKLDISRCAMLANIDALAGAPHLEVLSIHSAPHLKKLPQIPNIKQCYLSSLPGLNDISELVSHASLMSGCLEACPRVPKDQRKIFKGLPLRQSLNT